ncbi:MAG TPA: response regulator [Egibacteraceae bacterium]|nr:response regulator [Egibacteraceae bacterium]
MARVLVVDDNEDIRELVARQLRANGHKAVAVGSPSEALAIVDERGAPDVAVLDVAMPEMDGLQLLRELRAREGMSDLPAIFLSARVQEHDIQAGRDLGAIYLTKPFIASALIGAISDLVEPKDAGTW